MDLLEVVKTASRPYTTLRWESSIFGELFTTKQLAFTMEAQTQSNWCWAATATSVSHYYWLFSHWTQCKVACNELSRTDCCGSPVPSECNVPWYLDRALTRTDNLDSFTGAITFDRIKQEIDAGRPIGARIEWGTGGGHFMVIYGYGYFHRRVHSRPRYYVDIDDPIYGKQHVSLDAFTNNYRGDGRWTSTFFTKEYYEMPWIPIRVEEPILRRIWELREILDVKQAPGPQYDGHPDPRPVDIGFAQRLYTLGLDGLLSGKTEPTQAGLRVYESQAGTLTAYFDVEEGEDPTVRQMSSAAAYLESVSRASNIAVPLAEGDERDCEVRLLRVPALNFEAVWLSHEDGAGDQLVPLRAVRGLAAGETYGLAEAIDELRRAARPLVDMDDMMGA
ncbi:papain-like cysteine protease family protein [Nocardia crassostreae]|uniref:papain-like cysteine protease family protein n=1 Tax=Nocardia crassostreae TaxID=53428 RepID=UPI000ABC4DCE|nr:papain-like cysteine protease family protein [Nocardia crassostreae]